MLAREDNQAKQQATSEWRAAEFVLEWNGVAHPTPQQTKQELVNIIQPENPLPAGTTPEDLPNGFGINIPLPVKQQPAPPAASKPAPQAIHQTPPVPDAGTAPSRLPWSWITAGFLAGVAVIGALVRTVRWLRGLPGWSLYRRRIKVVLRVARKLGVHVRQAANLRLAADNAARELRLVRNAMEAQKAERRGTVRWLVRISQTGENEPSRAEVYQQIATALGLSEASVWKIATSTDEERVPPYLAASDVKFSAELVRSVAPELVAAHRELADLIRATRAKRDAAMSAADVAKAAITTKWAQRLLGLAHSLLRITDRVLPRSFDTPAVRSALVRMPVAVIGATGGLAVGGAVTVPIAVGMAITVTVVAAIARGVWWLRQGRAPPSANTSIRTALRRTLAGAVWFGMGWTAPTVIMALAGMVTTIFGQRVDGITETAFGHTNMALSTFKALLAVVFVGVPLAFRYVLNRRTELAKLGRMQTQPRRDALRSAMLSGAINIGYNLARLAAYVSLVPLLTVILTHPSRLDDLIAFAVVFLGAFVQLKEVGGVRLWKSGIAGLMAVIVAPFAAAVGVANSPDNWHDWWTAAVPWVVLLSLYLLVAELVVDGVGRIGLKLSKAQQRAARRDAGYTGPERALTPWERVLLRLSSIRRKADSPPTERDLRKAERINQRQLDFTRFNRIDWPVVAVKLLDSLIVYGLNYLIIRPWPGFPETPLMVAARTVMAVAVVAFTWRLRDRFERRTGTFGFMSQRTRSPLGRAMPIGLVPGHLAKLEIGRVKRRIHAYPTRLREFLAYAKLISDTRQQSELTRDLAEQVTQKLIEILNTLPAEWPELRARPNDPLARLRSIARDASQHHQRHNQKLTKYIIPQLAWELPGLRGTLVPLRKTGRDEDAAIVQFQIWLIEALNRPENLQALGISEVTGMRRGRLEARFAEILEQRRRLKVDFLKGPWMNLLRARWDAANGHDPVGRILAEYGLVVVDGHLQAERAHKIDPRPWSAVRQYFGSRRRSLRELADNEYAASIRAGQNGVGADAVLHINAILHGYESHYFAHSLIQPTVELVDEIGFNRANQRHERSRWRDAIAGAIANPLTQRGSLLDAVLAIVSSRTAVTKDTLVRRFGGTESRRQQQLDQLRKMGAIEGNPISGYRVGEQLRTRWLRASPRLRRALRLNALKLAEELGYPGLKPLDYGALLELLDAADRTNRHHLRWVIGRLARLAYRLRYPDSRTYWPPNRKLRKRERIAAANLLRHHAAWLRVAERLAVGAAQQERHIRVTTTRVPRGHMHTWGARAPPAELVAAHRAHRAADEALRAAVQRAGRQLTVAGVDQLAIDQMVARAGNTLAGPPSTPVEVDVRRAAHELRDTSRQLLKTERLKKRSRISAEDMHAAQLRAGAALDEWHRVVRLAQKAGVWLEWPVRGLIRRGNTQARELRRLLPGISATPGKNGSGNGHSSRPQAYELVP